MNKKQPIKGYVLIKDKEGNLKYYKDGRFFDLEEIRRLQQKSREEKKQKSKKLEPVFTLEQRKRQNEKQEKENKSTEKKTKPAEKEMNKLSEKKEIVEKNKEYSAERDKDKDKDKNKNFDPQSKNKEIDLEEVRQDKDLFSKRNQDHSLVDRHVNAVMDKLKVKFSDELIKTRFANILITYFRGIRSDKEIFYILTLPKSSGGLELPEEKAKVVLAAVREEAKNLDHKRKKIISGKSEEKNHLLEPPPPEVIDKKEPIENLADKMKKSQERKSSMEKNMGKPMVKRPGKNKRQEFTGPKPEIKDVKSEKRLIGPIDELEMMTLDDFRRLGRDEEEIKEELIEKIQILEEESFVKRVKGLNAWKRSPVFKLYLEMMLQGINQKKSINRVIEDRQRKNIPNLTLSEYEMIADFNNKISV